MLIKNISVRCPVEIYRKAKLKMIADLGEDNFTRLIVAYLSQYADGEAAVSVESPKQCQEVIDLERCLAINPDLTRAYLLSLQSAIESLGAITANAQATAASGKEAGKKKA